MFNAGVRGKRAKDSKASSKLAERGICRKYLITLTA